MGDEYKMMPCARPFWPLCKPGSSLSTVHPKGHLFNWAKVNPNKPIRTIASSDARMVLHWKYQRTLSDLEIIRAQSFPDDYNFLKSAVGYVCGMSVPPLMMQRLASSVYAQLLKS